MVNFEQYIPLHFDLPPNSVTFDAIQVGELQRSLNHLDHLEAYQALIDRSWLSQHECKISYSHIGMFEEFATEFLFTQCSNHL